MKISPYEPNGVCQAPGEGEVWTLLSKLPNPHPEAASYPGITFIGSLGSGSTHPEGADAGSAINGWNVFAVCSATQPANDSNNHYWIAGDPTSFGSLVYATGPNPSPVCSESRLVPVRLGCNDDRRDDLLALIASCPENQTQSVGGIGPSTATSVVIPGGEFVSVVIVSVSGVQTLPAFGGFQVGSSGGLPKSLTADATNHPCVNGVLQEIEISNPAGQVQWAGIRKF